MITLLRVRFPDNIKEYLAKRAKENDRSMNAELNHIIKQAMKTEATYDAVMQAKTTEAIIQAAKDVDAKFDAMMPEVE